MDNGSPDNDATLGWLERSRRDTRPTDVLVAAALEEQQRELDNPDVEPAPGWTSALVALQAKGTRDILDTALSLCASSDKKKRLLGVAILGELGTPRTFPKECCDALVNLLRNDPDIDVIRAAVFAFGHLSSWDQLESAWYEPELIALKNHKDDGIRHGVAFALCGTTQSESVKALLQLMEDSHSIARDWATTAIGQTVAIDGPEIREALLRRTSDSDLLTREEAINGLALRKDIRVVPVLRKELPREEVGRDAIYEAAKTFLGFSEDASPTTSELLDALKAAEI